MSNESKWISWVLTAVAIGALVAGYVVWQQPRVPPLPIQACEKNPQSPLCQVPPAVPATPGSGPVMGLAPCPTGQCDPISNGEGVYFAKLPYDEARHYCLPGLCLEAFVNTASGVVVEGRNAEPTGNDKGHLETRDVYVSVDGGPDHKALRVTSDGQGKLAITYDVDGQARADLNPELANVTLKLRSSQASVDLKFTPVKDNPALGPYQTYTAEYGSAEGKVNLLCGGKQVAFLSGKRIAAPSARVTLDPDATTIACQSGAIAKCTGLGYVSRGESATPSPQQIDYVFASCLQAMRAAYFVSQGDYRSYTEEGTKIYMRDLYGIQAGPMDRLEALWSPNGAVCLNVENRRGTIAFPKPEVDSVRRCGGSAEWTEQGKLATSLASEVSQLALRGGL